MNTEEILMQLLDGQKQMNEQFKQVNNRLDRMEADISEVKADITELKANVVEIKEDTSITRTATNRNGEQLDELVSLLQDTGVISR